MNSGVTSIPMFQLVWELQRYKHNETGNSQSLLFQATELLDDHRRQGHHVIMSSEHFTSKLLHWNDEDDNHDFHDSIAWENMKWLLDGFHVRVIIGYRHYMEWLPSMYYQHHHQDERYLQWENQGGLSHPSFWEWAGKFIKAWEKGKESSNEASANNLPFAIHPTLQALRLWSKHFDDFRLLSLHELESNATISDDDSTTSSPLTKFVCDMLPTAYHTCQALKTKGVDHFLPSPRMRVSSDFHADRLVEEAYRQGKLRTVNENNQTVVKTLLVQFAKHMLRREKLHEDDRYWTCGEDDTSDRLFRKRSLEMSTAMMEQVMHAREWNKDTSHGLIKGERNIRENTGSSGRQALVDQGYKALVVTQKNLCDINVTMILSNETLAGKLLGEFWISVS